MMEYLVKSTPWADQFIWPQFLHFRNEKTCFLPPPQGYYENTLINNAEFQMKIM